MKLVERVWRGASPGLRAVRTLALPFEAAFRAVTGVRNRLYDAGYYGPSRAPIAAVSVGNLTVGGTGKTPFSAWLARELGARGARPAIVMRGYGDDEPLVHVTLNPDVPVFVTRKRSAGMLEARLAGCDVAVLDDAFQNRQTERVADVVLVSADAWTGSVRLLPAGPWREPLSSLRRATLAIITRRAADDVAVTAVRAAVAAHASALPVAVVRLSLGELRPLVAARRESTRPITDLARRRVLAVAGVADSDAFFAQLESAGAIVTRRPFADHHAYSDRDVRELLAAAADHDMMVCTLKDAVKVSQLWPRPSPGSPSGWYVSQAVVIEEGAANVTDVIERLMLARKLRT